MKKNQFERQQLGQCKFNILKELNKLTHRYHYKNQYHSVYMD